MAKSKKDASTETEAKATTEQVVETEKESNFGIDVEVESEEEQKQQPIELVVEHNRKEFTINLDEPAPFELLEKKQYKMWGSIRVIKDADGNPIYYLPGNIVVQICRQLGIKRKITRNNIKIVDTGYIVDFHITFELSTWDHLEWYSIEHLSSDKMVKSGQWAVHAVRSRAEKEALRWKWKFFDVAFFEGEDLLVPTEEEVKSAEDTIKNIAEAKEGKAGTIFWDFNKDINEADSVNKLTIIAGKIKTAVDEKRIDESEKNILLKNRNAKKELLSK
jgi:hypothetical protein